MQIKRVHMIGIGGVSMSGIAHILNKFGYEVTGSDQNDSDLIQSLRDVGIEVTMLKKQIWLYIQLQ